MSRENKTCKNCGKPFHACGSCGLLNDWEYNYCCHGCWHSSKDYIEYRVKFSILYKMAKRAELHGDLADLVDEGIMSEYDIYELIVELEESDEIAKEFKNK